MRPELELVTAKVEDAAGRLGIKEWEAFVLADIGTGVEIAGGKITLSAESRETGVGLRVIEDGSMGFTYCTPEGVEVGLRHARAGCTIGQEVKGGFAPPTEGGRDGYDSALASMDWHHTIEAASELLEGGVSAGEVEPSRGRVAINARHYLVANSAGTRAYSRGAALSGYLMCTARRGDDVATGIEEFVARRPNVDFTETGRKAGENAISSLGGRLAPDGELRVILRPMALFDLLQNTMVPGLFGASIERGESFYSKKMGQKVAASGITVADDPTILSGPSSFGFDEEGAGSRRVKLVEDGVLVGAMYDHFAAARHGAAATASGMRYVRLDHSTSHRRPPTTGSRNLVMEAETMPYDELLSETRRGVVVDYVLGSHTANRVSQDFSVAVYVGYYVEDGEIKHPLKGGMLSGNAAAMLNEIVIADDVRALAGGSGSGACLPSAAVEGLRYSA